MLNNNQSINNWMRIMTSVDDEENLSVLNCLNESKNFCLREKSISNADT